MDLDINIFCSRQNADHTHKITIRIALVNDLPNICPEQSMNAPYFNIAAVERDTGLSKDVLRVWERRYGFPTPGRDGNGERLYTPEQVDRLRLIKRLMDLGYRPGKLIAATEEDLLALARQARDTPAETMAGADTDALAVLLAAIRDHDAHAYQQAMQQRLARQGLQRFVQDTVAPLVRQVGEAWEDGRFEIFEEHLFTELTQRTAASRYWCLAKRRA